MSGINQCRIGLYEKALPSFLSWNDRLRIAKESGYDFVELSIDETDERLRRLEWSTSEKTEITKSLYANGMSFLTMCLSGNRRFPIGSENLEIRETGIRLIKSACTLSVDLGIRIVQLAGYDEFYNPRNVNTEFLFREALFEVVDFASSVGVTLAFENMDTDFMDTISKAMEFISMVDSPFLQVYPDVGNLTAIGLTPEKIGEEIRSAKGHIVAVHLKDARERIIRNVPYGEGLVDFSTFFSHLRRNNFSGLFVAEMWSDESQSSIGYIEQANKFLRQKMVESM